MEIIEGQILNNFDIHSLYLHWQERSTILFGRISETVADFKNVFWPFILVWSIVLDDLFYAINFSFLSLTEYGFMVVGMLSLIKRGQKFESGLGSCWNIWQYSYNFRTEFRISLLTFYYVMIKYYCCNWLSYPTSKFFCLILHFHIIFTHNLYDSYINSCHLANTYTRKKNAFIESW